VLCDIAHGQEHPVAVVAREHQCRAIDNLNKARVAAFVRDRRLPLVIDGRKEEHVPGFDEAFRFLVKLRLARELLDAIGHVARAEHILQCTMLFTVESAHVCSPFQRDVFR